MIFDLRALVLSAGPHGRHWIPGESFCRSSARCRTRASAEGWISPGFRSAAMLRSYLSEILCHRPDMSGLPSAVRGAGAVRLGLPPGVRGMPGVGCFSHCAASGVVSADRMIAKTTVFIPYLLRGFDPSILASRNASPHVGSTLDELTPLAQAMTAFRAPPRSARQPAGPRALSDQQRCDPFSIDPPTDGCQFCVARM